MSAYPAPDEVVIFLINKTVNGTPEQRLASKFILDCLRNYRTSEEIAHCIDDLEKRAILDLAADARSMASDLGLIE
jgi:hypothetical protein